MSTPDNSTFELLISTNQQFANDYRSSGLLELIASEDMSNIQCRSRLLDLIQTLSNYFQRVMLLRSALADDAKFSAFALTHLKEEFCHHEQLLTERNHQPPAWDPILEATCSWFTWKMMTTNDEEKTVLIHLVFETSGSIFFQAAYQIMQQYYSTEYFKVHSAADEEHEKMGMELLKNLTPETYKRLLEIQNQGWQMMITACNRIATLAASSA